MARDLDDDAPRRRRDADELVLARQRGAEVRSGSWRTLWVVCGVWVVGRVPRKLQKIGVPPDRAAGQLLCSPRAGMTPSRARGNSPPSTAPRARGWPGRTAPRCSGRPAPRARGDGPPHQRAGTQSGQRRQGLADPPSGTGRQDAAGGDALRARVEHRLRGQVSLHRLHRSRRSGAAHRDHCSPRARGWPRHSSALTRRRRGGYLSPTVCG